MKISYDNQADAIYIYFNVDRVLSTEEVKPGFVVDYAKNGKIVGLEILDASKKLPKKALNSINIDFGLIKNLT